MFIITSGCVEGNATHPVESRIDPTQMKTVPTTILPNNETQITLTPTVYTNSEDYEYVGARQVRYSSDGNFLYAAGQDGIFIFDTKDYLLSNFIDIESSVIDIALSPDNQYITASTFDYITTIRISTEEILYSIDSSSYTIVPEHNIVYSPDGQLLFSGGYSSGDTISIWDASDGTLLRTIDIVCYISAIAFSPDGRFWATTGSYDSCSTSIWDIDGNLVDEHGPFVSGGGTGALAFSPNGNIFADGAETCRLWRINNDGSLDEIGEMYVGGSRIFDSMEFSPDGKFLAAGTNDGLYIWQIDNGALIHYLDTYNSRSGGIAWSPEGSILAIGTAENGIELWDALSGTKIREVDVLGNND